MIIDTLDHLEKYVALNPLFPEVVKFLKQHPLAHLSEGKHAILEQDFFVNIQTAQGKTREAAVLECHRRMIDIQIPLSGSETYGYTPVAALPPASFNEEKDIAKYPGSPCQTYVTVHPGQFAIFFPQDGHAPCITDQPQLLKAIFKVKA